MRGEGCLWEEKKKEMTMIGRVRVREGGKEGGRKYEGPGKSEEREARK